MEYLFYLSIIAGVLGQLVKLPLGPGNFYPQDGLVVLTCFVFIFTKLVGQRDKKLENPSFLPLLFFFCFWAVISLIHGSYSVSGADLAEGASYLIRFAVYAFFSIIAFDLNKTSPGFAGRALGVLILSGLFIALAGFVQLIIYPDLTQLAREFGYDPHKNRLVSTFLDPNFSAAYLVLGLSLLAGLRKNIDGFGVPYLSNGTVRAVTLLVLLLALILTFSRSGWLMLAAVLFLYSILRSPKLLVLAAIIGFLAYFAVPRVQTRIAGITDPDDSARLRFVSWSHAVTVWRSNPVFGVGFNLYRSAQEDFGFFDYTNFQGGHAGAGSDSSLLLVLATTGIVGLSLYLSLGLNIFAAGWRKLRNPIGLSVVLSVFGLLFDSQFINSLFFPQIMLWIWILVGLV